jgi:hypothetical protein
MTQQCGRCIYYRDNGECHRFPPNVPSPFPAAPPMFPTVESNEWCGEYKYDSKNEDGKKDSNKAATDAVIAHYKSEFNRVFGAIPQLSVKDRAAAKVLAKEHSGAQAASIITEFLTIPPQWNKERGAYDLKFIPGNANSILARGKGIAEDDTMSFLKTQAEHRHNPKWFEYVDYVKKSGKRVTYEEWNNG